MLPAEEESEEEPAQQVAAKQQQKQQQAAGQKRKADQQPAAQQPAKKEAKQQGAPATPAGKQQGAAAAAAAEKQHKQQQQQQSSQQKQQLKDKEATGKPAAKSKVRTFPNGFEIEDLKQVGALCVMCAHAGRSTRATSLFKAFAERASSSWRALGSSCRRMAGRTCSPGSGAAKLASRPGTALWRQARRLAPVITSLLRCVALPAGPPRRQAGQGGQEGAHAVCGAAEEQRQGV